ncbi:GIY-YIG nuclease family protein [Mangrovimonas sp. DI 80]|uniref:GIY-YIG nuclease family protein n=1 Tax=Mangrovimonas sp. DI 80 TaxID=1779330 RepID=UPI0009769B43|nr:GIY-YIG nuclease family protein [Mangrovimonas sp. DI 80]OMP31147.1 hypothetical protein BKM32_08780 [Mangrovimonas sp. DI 80]
MRFYYVYILQYADGSYYTGLTNNLQERLTQHNLGIDKSCYTATRRPLNLAWHLQCTSPTEAINREKQIKGWSRKKKKALIENNWKDLERFSKNYTQYGIPRPPSTSSG